jgi:hypothetical protein
VVNCGGTRGDGVDGVLAGIGLEGTTIANLGVLVLRMYFYEGGHDAMLRYPNDIQLLFIKRA